MCPAILLNRHRGLGPDELTRKYRKTRDADYADSRWDCDDEWYDYDDCWDTQRGWTADDHLVLGALEESIGFASRGPKLGALLPGALTRGAPIEPAPTAPEPRPRHPPEELAEALFAHLQHVLSRARAHHFAFGEDLVRIEDSPRHGSPAAAHGRAPDPPRAPRTPCAAGTARRSAAPRLHRLPWCFLPPRCGRW